MATWYKKKIKDSILAQVYNDKNKIQGLNVKEPQSNEPNDVEAIYQRYLQAFKKGVYNYIKEGIDPITKETMPRKYFSGGTNFGNKAMAAAYRTTTDLAMLPQDDRGHENIISITVNPVESGLLPKNQAMVGRGAALRQERIFSIINRIQETGRFTEGPALSDIYQKAKNVGQVLLKTGMYRAYLDSIFDKALRYPNGKSSTKIVFLKAGAEPLFEAARLMAQMTGIFPPENIHSIWATMRNYNAIGRDPQQAELFVKYLYDQDILTPDTKNLLIVDTDTGIANKPGTEAIFIKTLFNDALIDRVNAKFGLNLPKFNDGPGSINTALYYMFYPVMSDDTAKLIKRQKLRPGRVNISGYKDPLPMPEGFSWLFIDNFFKTESVQGAYKLRDNKVQAVELPPREQPFEGEVLMTARQVQYTGLLAGVLDVLEARGQDVSQEADALIKGLEDLAMKATGKQAAHSDDVDDRTLEQKWAAYVIREKLTAYPELMPLFTPAIRRALLEDSALRPVFLQVLPGNKMGPIMVPYYNKKLVETAIGGKTLIDYIRSYSSFLTGDAGLANTLTRQGKTKIVVGVTDKYSPKTIGFHGRVANGRQCYFPLPDGTWLGIKGSGQFASDNSPPFQIRLNTEGELVFGYGLVTEGEAQRAGIATGNRANGLGQLLFNFRI